MCTIPKDHVGGMGWDGGSNGNGRVGCEQGGRVMSVIVFTLNDNDKDTPLATLRSTSGHVAAH